VFFWPSRLFVGKMIHWIIFFSASLLDPNFDGRALRNVFQRLFQLASEFFEILNGFNILTGMLRACADMRDPQIVQDLPHMPLVIINAKARFDQGLQVHPPPPNNPAHLRVRTSFEQVC
jgi:hypothetical protein